MENPIKPAFSYDFPMVFLWFSYGFPMVFQAGYHINSYHKSLPGGPCSGQRGPLFAPCDAPGLHCVTDLMFIDVYTQI